MTESPKAKQKSQHLTLVRDEPDEERPDSLDTTRVMVVGEEEALVQALRDAGYEVDHLASGAEAEHLLLSRHVDTLVVDYDLADMRGDLFHAIAGARRPNLRTHTIMLAGPDKARIKAARQATDCLVLPRPLNVVKAVKAIRKLG